MEGIHVGVIPDITLFIQVIIFFIFMFVMKKIYFEPYLQAFDERERTIENLMKEAEENNKKTAEILSQVDEILNKTKLETQKIMDQYHQETNEMVAALLKKAQTEAEEMIEDAKKEVERVVEIEKKTMDKIVENLAKDIVNKLLLKEKAA